RRIAPERRRRLPGRARPPDRPAAISPFRAGSPHPRSQGPQGRSRRRGAPARSTRLFYASPREPQGYVWRSATARWNRRLEQALREVESATVVTPGNFESTVALSEQSYGRAPVPAAVWHAPGASSENTLEGQPTSAQATSLADSDRSSRWRL